MQKLVNSPDAYVDEVIEGILVAHPSVARGSSSHTLVYRAGEAEHKVAIVTGGGSGHMPLFAGYLGDGLADGVAVGQVFASPSADAIYSVARDVDRGRGVLFLYGNYGGDRLNFEKAKQRLESDGIEVRSVRAADDVASAPRAARRQRRGVAGIALLYKIAGAAAREGLELADVADVVERAAAGLASMGVALSSCVLPAVGKAAFEVADGTVEVGMGLHGEPGVGQGPLRPADEVVTELVERLLVDLDVDEGARIDVLVNGLGATPAEELYIVLRRCAQLLASRNVVLRRSWVGEYATSLEMAGASVSMLRVDDELTRLLDSPASGPMLERL